MLSPYRRHVDECRFTGVSDRKCKCPIWVDGRVDGVRVRKSLKTRSWERALKSVGEMNQTGIVEAAPVSMEEACDRFIADCKARNLKPASLAKYELLARELKWELAGPLKAVTLPQLRQFQGAWKLCPESALYKLSRVRKFFRFCLDNGWIKENPARGLSRPIFQKKQAVPFTAEEMEKILWATEIYPDDPKGRREKVRAFVLVMRYTGLRIGDVVSLRRQNIQGNKLLMRTAKTGTQVWLPLQEKVLVEIEAIISAANSDYLFFSGNGTLKSAIGSWHRSLSTLFKLARVKGHSHQFRHFFSVDLLSKGVSIEDVAALLGHSSSLITARHYNAFVKVRQERLEAAISRVWAAD